uniref:NAD(P)-dependent dehydrogenase, short-chain alcohol dehydrogenase family n=1 Tax=Candidatus Kentrum sp. TUN TaxID=2126343 RepID=A0A451AIL3_9GAMM|nr:MAG: NAD(P)-dependent dehydrogenase, short-chain alcohol dehydrogenase family [Candidatus Kentron sp. TUN]
MSAILITGTNRGIGLELTRQYANDGWRVFACCRSPGSAYVLDKLAGRSDGRIEIYQLDVTNAAQRASLVERLDGQPIDILYNNAGIPGNWGVQGFGQCQADAWLEVLHTNVIGPMSMMQDFVENVAISERKIIANITSKLGSIADNNSGGSYFYRSSKAALNMVTVSAAQDLAMRGITVVSLHPGWVRTDMGGSGGKLSVEESVTALRKNRFIRLKRTWSDEEP